MSSLFRREALEHQKETFFGDVLLIQPLSFTVLSVISGVVGFFIVLFLTFGSYTPKQMVSGYLVPDQGMSKIYAPVASTVAQIPVEEGQAVEAGALLLSGQSLRGSEQGDDLDAALLKELSQTQQEVLKKRDLDEKLFITEQNKLNSLISSTESEVTQLQRQIETLDSRFELAKQREANARQLADNGHIPEASWQEQSESRLLLQQQLEELQRQAMLREAALVGYQHDLEGLPNQQEAKRIDYSNTLSDLRQRQAEIEARRQYALRAPMGGQITALQTQVGQSVAANQLLMAVVPPGSTQHAELFIPTRAVGFVRPGLPVRIRYSAFPHEKFGIYEGVVKQVSKTILLPAEMPIPVALNEPVYRVIVDIDTQEINAKGEAIPLQPGMLLEADILLENRKLWEWIMSPIYNFQGRL